MSEMLYANNVADLTANSYSDRKFHGIFHQRNHTSKSKRSIHPEVEIKRAT